MSITQLLLLLAVYYLLIRPLIRGMGGPAAPPRGNAKHILKMIYKVAGDIAHADGKESADELNIVVAIVRQALANPSIPAEQIIRDYKQYSSQRWTAEDAQHVAPHMRRVLLQVAINVAASDNVIDNAELERIRHIGATLQIGHAEIEEMLRSLGGRGSRQDASGRSISAIDYALEVMELEQGASWGQIKKQYKRMAMKLHPDRAPEHEKQTATEKFKELGDAYRILKDRYS